MKSDWKRSEGKAGSFKHTAGKWAGDPDDKGASTLISSFLEVFMCVKKAFRWTLQLFLYVKLFTNNHKKRKEKNENGPLRIHWLNPPSLSTRGERGLGGGGRNLMNGHRLVRSHISPLILPNMTCIVFMLRHVLRQARKIRIF